MRKVRCMSSSSVYGDRGKEDYIFFKAAQSVAPVSNVTVKDI